MKAMHLTLTKLATTAFLVATLSACAPPATGNGKGPNARCNPGAAQGTSPAGLDFITLCIESKKTVRQFIVEAARSPEQQQQGLMFRTELADTAGMIFPFNNSRMASFWMKNTVISLDIIFIKADGRIENIAENTTPYSTDSVTATAPVTAVLELRAGLTRELGIGPGDKVVWQSK